MALLDLFMSLAPVLLLAVFTPRDLSTPNYLEVNTYGSLRNTKDANSISPLPPPPPCFDGLRNLTVCTGYKAQGLCTKDRSRMYDECRLTCGLCKVISTSCIILTSHGVPFKFCFNPPQPNHGPVRPLPIPSTPRFIAPTPQTPSHCVTLLFRGAPHSVCFPEEQPTATRSHPVLVQETGQTCIDLMFHGGPERVCFDPPKPAATKPTDTCVYPLINGHPYPICTNIPPPTILSANTGQLGERDEEKGQTCWTILVRGAPTKMCISDSTPSTDHKPEKSCLIVSLRYAAKKICFDKPTTQSRGVTFSSDNSIIKLDDENCCYPLFMGSPIKTCFPKKPNGKVVCIHPIVGGLPICIHLPPLIPNVKN